MREDVRMSELAAVDQMRGTGARIERGRRYLLAGPPDPALAIETWRIVDRYIQGTRLRLRAIHRAQDRRRLYQLTQQIPPPPDVDVPRGVRGLITNTYLDAAEYERLATLPGAMLVKTRHSVPPFGVDVFEGQLAGLVLAETDFESDASCAAFVPPLDGRARIITEVTDDPRFRGECLALTTAAQLRAFLDEFGLSPHAP
jgi:hypothetical protein